MAFKVRRRSLIVSSALWFLLAAVSQAQLYPQPGQTPYRSIYPAPVTYDPYGPAHGYPGTLNSPQRGITYTDDIRYRIHNPPRNNGSYDGRSNRDEYRDDDNRVNRYDNRYFGREDYNGGRNGTRFDAREDSYKDDRNLGRDKSDDLRNGSRLGSRTERYKDDGNLGRDNFDGGRSDSRSGNRTDRFKDDRNFGRDNSDSGRKNIRLDSRDDRVQDDRYLGGDSSDVDRNVPPSNKRTDRYGDDRTSGARDYDGGRNSSRFGNREDRDGDYRVSGRDEYDAGRRNRVKHSRLFGRSGRYSGRSGGRYRGSGRDRGQSNRGDKFGRAHCEPIPSYIPGIKIDPAKLVGGADTDSRRNIIGLTGTWFPYKLYTTVPLDGEFTFTNAITRITILDDDRVVQGTSVPAITAMYEVYERYSPEGTLPATECVAGFSVDHIGENGAIASLVIGTSESDAPGTTYNFSSTSQTVLAVDYDIFQLTYQCADDHSDSRSACETPTFLVSIRDSPGRLSTRQVAHIDGKVNQALTRYCITAGDFYTFLTDRDAEPCPMSEPPSCFDGMKQAHMDSSST